MFAAVSFPVGWVFASIAGLSFINYAILYAVLYVAYLDIRPVKKYEQYERIAEKTDLTLEYLVDQLVDEGKDHGFPLSNPTHDV